MTIASANVLLEQQELEVTASRRSRVAKALGMRALTQATKRATHAVGSFLKAHPAIHIGVGTALMTVGLAAAAAGVMEVGKQASERMSHNLYSALVKDGSEAGPARDTHAPSVPGQLGSGSAGLLTGAALTVHGLRANRRRAIAREGNWTAGIRGTRQQELPSLHRVPFAAAYYRAADPTEVTPSLFALDGMLDRPYHLSRLEQAERRFGEGAVRICETAINTGRSMRSAITSARERVATARAGAAAASQYDGFGTVSVMIERPGLHVPDYTA